MNTTKTKPANKHQAKTATKPIDRRHLPVFVTLAILLGVLALSLFTIYSFKSVLLAVAANSTNGHVYLTTKCHNHPATCSEEIEKAREQYDGKNIGTLKLYQDAQLGGGYFVIDAKAVENLLFTKLSLVPENKIPVFVPAQVAPTQLNTQYLPVGSYLSPDFTRIDAGVFTPITKQITTLEQKIYMIQDKTDKIEKFLLKQWSEHQQDSKPEASKLNNFLTSESTIVVFDDYQKALSYQKAADRIQFASTNSLFSNVLEINHIFNDAFIVLYTVTVIIALLTIAAAIDVIYANRRVKATR